MNDKIRPLGDRVWVERLEHTEKTAGGLIIPDSAKEKGQTGKVLAVGPGKSNSEGKVIPMQVRVGDTVFFGKYAGTETGDKHIMIREDEILGIVEK